MDSETIRKVFPQKLKYYMALNQKSRSDLVHDLKFKYSTVRDWEKGLTVPRMDRVEALANYFGCSNSDLLENKKEQPTATDDGLSDNQLKLIEFAKTVPEDKAEMILRVMKSIVEAD